VTLRFPHPLTLLVGGILLAALLTHLVPAGRFDRRVDPVTGREVAVAGTYREVPATPVGVFDAMAAVPRGIQSAAMVIAFVFLVGGAFSVVDRTGALRRIVELMVRGLSHRPGLVIPVSCLLFGLAGVLMQMQEEIIAFVPVLLLLSRRLGYDRLTAVGMSLGASAVGAAFSPINPFQVGIAQKVAGLPLLSGSGFRLAVLLPAVAIWAFFLYRHAAGVRVTPAAEAPAGGGAGGRRLDLILLLVLATFAMFVYGVKVLEWDFDQSAALFFSMGVLAGLIGGLGIEGTTDAFGAGFREMTLAALLIGFARGIFVVMDQGNIIDTVVHALFTPLASLPVVVSALGMLGIQSLIHVPVPSTSGQAVLTLPVLIPLSDLLGLSRQVTVLAYQYGAGLCELITPTNGALMAMLVAAGVGFEDWLRFAWRPLAVLYVVGALAVATGVLIHLA
jgi:uncharacterized ion transporter superfamily protein YfcC